MTTRTRSVAPPTVAPRATGATVHIISFSPENPTLATVAAGEGALLTEGDYLAITVTAGSLPEVNGTTAPLTMLAGDTFYLPYDLTAYASASMDATADATVVEQPPAPTPPPLPEPGAGNHAMASKSPGTTTIWHPAPGVGGNRVAENEADTAPGSRFADEPVPDPAAPLSKTLTNAEALARFRAAQREQPTEPPPFAPDPPPAPQTQEA